MKYLLKNLFYTSDGKLIIMDLNQNGTIMYKDVFTNAYYPTNQYDQTTNLLDLIQSLNLEVLILNENGGLEVNADIEKLKYILNEIKNKKSQTKTAKDIASKVALDAANQFITITSMNPEAFKYAITASKLEKFKLSLVNLVSAELLMKGSSYIEEISDLKLQRSFYISGINFKNIRFDKKIKACMDGKVTVTDKLNQQSKSGPDFQKLLRKESGM